MQNTILEGQPSKKSIAYEGIKQLIMEGKLTKDTPLVERKLCEILGVSRTPVREALRELASEGLVEIIDGKGIYVKKIDFKDMIEIFEMREALECMAIALFIERAGDDELALFKELMHKQDEAYKNGEHEKFMKIDMKLHNLIADGAQNARIKYAVKNIYDQIQQMAIAAKDETLIRDMAVKAHKDIYKAILDRDAKEAQDSMRQHIIEVKNFYKDRYYLL